MAKLTKQVLQGRLRKDVQVDTDEATGQPITVTIRALDPEEFFGILPDEDLGELEGMSKKDAIKFMRGEPGRPSAISLVLLKGIVDPKVTEDGVGDTVAVHDLGRYSMHLFTTILEFSGFGRKGAASFRPESASTDGGDAGRSVSSPTK